MVSHGNLAKVLLSFLIGTEFSVGQVNLYSRTVSKKAAIILVVGGNGTGQ